MGWILADVHGPECSGERSTIQRKGAWPHAACRKVYVINSTKDDIHVPSVPQDILSLDVTDRNALPTHITSGTTGILSGTPQAHPWEQRLRNGLDICESNISLPAIMIIDAPGTDEIGPAMAAVSELRSRINKVYKTNKLIVLAGPSNVEYPVLDEDIVAYSSTPWQDMQGTVQWGLRLVSRPSSTGDVRDMLAMMLGTMHVMHRSFTSTATYPHGYSVPDEMLSYTSFSDNVISGTATISRTRGITAQTSDGKPWSAKLVLNCPGAQESQTMVSLREMVTGTDAKEAGAHYFALYAVYSSIPSFLRPTLSAFHSKWAGANTLARGMPMCRVASHCPQREWG